MQFAKTSIFRPGLLDRGDKKRFREKVYGKGKMTQGQFIQEMILLMIL